MQALYAFHIDIVKEKLCACQEAYREDKIVVCVVGLYIQESYIGGMYAKVYASKR